jgi:hypothetical protein
MLHNGQLLTSFWVDFPDADPDAAGYPDFSDQTPPRFRFVEVTTREALLKETESGDCAYDYEG